MSVAGSETAHAEPAPLVNAGKTAAQLNDEACRLVFPVAATMVGVCLTAITVLHLGVVIHRRGTIADDVLSVDAILFLSATLSSYLAVRTQNERRLHWLERIADISFIAGMALLTGACLVITYAIES